MTLIGSQQNVIEAVGVVVNNLPTLETIDSFNAGVLWAKVARAFFASGVAPIWSEAGLAAGEVEFATVAKATITQKTFREAFEAFAKLAETPVNVVPNVGVASVKAPIAPLDFSVLETVDPQPDHVSASVLLHTALVQWTMTGSNVLVGGGSTPWS